jgi:DNA polymerase III sliding clamp (beta) subunit (PCNA family)
VSGREASLVEIDDTFPCRGDALLAEITLQARYVSDAFGAIGADEVQLHAVAAMRPIWLRAVNAVDGVVIMPMRGH